MLARLTLLLITLSALGACATSNPLMVAPATLSAASVTSTHSAPTSPDVSGQVVAVPADDTLSIIVDGSAKSFELDGLQLPPPNTPQAEDARRVLERNLIFRKVDVVYLHGGHWNPINWFGAMPANIYTSDAGLDVRAYLYVARVATPTVVEVKQADKDEGGQAEP